MTNFIRLRNGDYIHPDMIGSIKSVPSNNDGNGNIIDVFEAFGRKGERLGRLESWNFNMETQPSDILVPATLGFFLAEASEERDIDGDIDIKFKTFPIIAWRVSAVNDFVSVHPVVAFNGFTDSDWWKGLAVVYPNGEVNIGNGTGERFKDIGKYREHLMERLASEAREAAE